MKIKNTSVMLVCLLLGVVVSPAFGQQSDDKKDWDGSWKFSYRLSKSDKEVKAAIRFMREDDKLVAQYRDSEKTKAKVEVNADGNEVELKLIYDAEWIAPTTLKGKLEKDRIVGKASYYAKDEVDWKAIRFLSLEEVTGKWQMTFTTPDGTERTPKFQLNEKDGKPEIKLIPDEGETDTAGSKVSNVKYKDGLLLFEVELDFQGQELNLEYELEFETSKTLVGSMFFSLPGIDQTGEVDLDGERIK